MEVARAHHPFGEFSCDEEERCEVVDGGDQRRSFKGKGVADICGLKKVLLGEGGT